MAAFYAAYAISVGNRIINKLKKMKGTSKETAKTLEELDLSGPEKRRLQQLVFIGKIIETEDGRYYVPSVKSHKTDSCSITRCSSNRNNNHRSKLDNTYTISRLINIAQLEFDNWKWLLTFICIFTFFFAVLPFPTIIFAGECYPLAYLWLIGWLCVAIILEHAVSVRKGKAKAAVKWYNNPNALDEYVEILNRD